MSAPSRETQPFHDLATDVEAFRAAFVATPREPLEVDAAAARLRERLDACRAAANSVYAHLEEHGISVGLVFMLRQLRERMLRVRELMDCLLSDTPHASTVRLLSRLATVGAERGSLRALIASNSSLLAAKLAERSAETGEHYITRTPAEYRSMLAKAAGGGAATALTTWAKFALGALGLAAFWGGFWAGAMYAASFMLIQLMHRRHEAFGIQASARLRLIAQVIEHSIGQMTQMPAGVVRAGGHQLQIGSIDPDHVLERQWTVMQ